MCNHYIYIIKRESSLINKCINTLPDPSFKKVNNSCLPEWEIGTVVGAPLC
jgi:hypothetical protein